MGSAKFTDNSKELKQWCLDIYDKYNKEEIEPVPDTSFASEVEAEANPSSNTKMII
jgi:hypothetical protein